MSTALMVEDQTGDHAWRASLYGSVYDALNRSLEPCARNVIAGTEGLIGRAICHFRAAGDGDAAAMLERIALAVSLLQLALRAGRDEAYAVHRHDLARLARAWLLASPMRPAPPEPLRLAA